MEDLLKKLGLKSSSDKIRITKNLNLSQVVLTPEEGFLLSRIDAVDSLEQLFMVSSFPEDKTALMLISFVDRNLIESDRTSGSKTPTRVPKAQGVPRKPREDIPALDDSFCFEIEDEFDRLQEKEMSPYDILGIQKSDNIKEAKKTYLKKTKKFHPDRFFRKEVGSYRKWSEFIFRKINEAFNELEYEFNAKKKGERSPLSGRMASSIKKNVDPKRKLQDQIFKANKLVKEAQALKMKDPTNALNTARMALQFDPRNEAAKALVEELQPRVDFRKALGFLQEAKSLEDILAFEQAGEFYEKAVYADPKNVEYLKKAGEFFLFKLKNPKKAYTMAQKAVELEPNLPDVHLLLGYVFKALKRHVEAKKVFERVLQLDKTNPFAKNELAQIKKI